jgi:hypothetical protein
LHETSPRMASQRVWSRLPFSGTRDTEERDVDPRSVIR